MEYIELSPQCLQVRVPRDSDFDQTFMVISDVHWDNPKCRRDLLERDLNLAKKIGADVYCIGDFFCAMQGQADRRKAKSDIRPEHNVNNYFDALVETAAEYLEPWYDNIKLLALGNHETSIIKNQETDLLGRLTQLIRHKGGECYRGNYGGYVWWRTFASSKGSIGINIPKRLFYHHGRWGGVVTKGVLGAARYAAVVPDADIVVSGHTHDNWSFSVPRYHLNEKGEVSVRDQTHLKTGTYKDEQTSMSGWFAERIFVPKSYKMWIIRMTGNTKNLNVGYYDTETALTVH